MTGTFPVAIYMEKSCATLSIMLGAVYAGCPYCLLDLRQPDVRLRQILKVLQPEVIVTKEENLEKIRNCVGEMGGDVRNTTILLAENCLNEMEIDQKLLKQIRKKHTDRNPLYINFTSGSTGLPKGVAVSHRAVIDFIRIYADTFDITKEDVIGNQAPFDFDVSVKDIFLSLRVGGRLEILEKKLFSFPKLLLERLNERSVDTIIWAVPALKILARLHAFQTLRPLYLKNIMFSGEVMPPKTLQYWMQAVPQARFVNLYGPTEITCNCTYHIVQSADEVLQEVPIGRPFANCDVFLLDSGEPVREEGRTGEICVTGSCLSLGYYNRPQLSAQVFVQNPLNSRFREPMYRTGDLGVWKNGSLLFAGRKDTQIKFMGHRIEMSEIELCANAAEGVEASACVFSDERLTLFYTGEAEEKALLARLRDRLPKYMLPSACRRLERFPQNRTGKIDRRALLILSKED